MVLVRLFLMGFCAQNCDLVGSKAHVNGAPEFTLCESNDECVIVKGFRTHRHESHLVHVLFGFEVPKLGPLSAKSPTTTQD